MDPILALPELPTSWVDDPELEIYAQTALDTKMLVIESLNFTSDRVYDVIDSMPPSDTTEDLRTLHEDLLSMYPDYHAFEAPRV